MEKNIQDVSWEGWETVRLIGSGSYGSVFEVQRRTGGIIEKAAIKKISIPQNDSDIEEMYNEGYDAETITLNLDGHLNDILAEYNLMREMRDCKNIVSCDDIKYEKHSDGIGWDIYIRMELLTPLTKWLAEDVQVVSDELVEKLTKDMCNALNMCKKHNVVHRDIKPQNIFVSENGDFKLGDFGIAKTMEKTIGGTKIGTYKYMAPEVYNNQPYGHSADIYSLGLVLYWVLNERRMPFMPLPPEKPKANSEEESRTRRFAGEPLPAPANGSDKLKKIVLKACAYHPNDRYKSVDEILGDIEGIIIVKPEEPEDPPPHKLTFFEKLKINELVNSFRSKKTKKEKDKSKKSKIVKIIAIVLAIVLLVNLLIEYGWVLLELFLVLDTGYDEPSISTEQTTGIGETTTKEESTTIVDEPESTDEESTTGEENTHGKEDDTTQGELVTEKDDVQKMLRKCRFEYDYINEIYFSELSAQQRKNEVADLGNETAKYTSVNSLNLDVDFKYDGYGWKLKWSKGQFGVLEGVELGIYNNKSGSYQLSKSDKLLDVDVDYYHSLNDYDSGNKMFRVDGTDYYSHWVSGYKSGVVDPKKNVVYISIYAEDSAMIDAIEQGLKNTGEFSDFFSLFGADNLTNHYTRIDDYSIYIMWYDAGHVSY